MNLMGFGHYLDQKSVVKDIKIERQEDSFSAGHVTELLWLEMVLITVSILAAGSCRLGECYGI